MPPHTTQIIALVRRKGLIRPRDLTNLGIPRRVLTELTAAGKLTKNGRGLYSLASGKISQNRSLAEASARVPSGVICLLSALRFHGLTTQNPWEVWMTIRRESQKPRVDYPPLRIVRASEKSISDGVEWHNLDGVEVPIYSAAKTVIDCFRYRNKIGVDVAVEALRDAWKKRKVKADDLWRFAAAGRVTRIIRPYMESTLI